jgi:hypothetical protein
VPLVPLAPLVPLVPAPLVLVPLDSYRLPVEPPPPMLVLDSKLPVSVSFSQSTLLHFSILTC